MSRTEIQSRESEGSGVTLVHACSEFVRANWKISFTAGLLGFVLSIYIVATTTPVYTARTILGEVDNSGLQNKSSPLNLIPPGLAAIASLGTVSGNKLDEFRMALTSVTVAASLIENDPNVLKIVFPHDWDEDAQKWRRRSGFVSSALRGVTELLAFEAWRPPNERSLAKYLNRHIQLTSVRGTAMYSLAFSHRDKQFALNLLTGAIQSADNFLKMRDRERALEHRKYALMQLKTVEINERRDALAFALGQAERSLVILQSDLPYVVAYIDPPYVENYPTWPRPIFQIFLISIICFILGIGVSVFLKIRVGK